MLDIPDAVCKQRLRARNERTIAGATNVLVVGYDYARWQRDVLGTFGSTASQHSRAFYAKDDVTLAGPMVELLPDPFSRDDLIRANLTSPKADPRGP